MEVYENSSRENAAEGSGVMELVEDAEEGSGAMEFFEDEYDEMEEIDSENIWDESDFRPPKMYRFDDPPFPTISYGEDVRKWNMLIEIFSVQFLDYKQVYSAQPYGTIFVDCAMWPHILFEHAPGDPLPVDDNGFLQLTDPTRVRTAFDDVHFCAFLSCLDKRVVKFHHKIWNSFLHNSMLLCNRLLTRSFSTPFGDIELNYAVFTESVTATLEIKLLDSKHDQGLQRCENMEVFGLVTAGTDMITDEKAKICMFKRDKDACAVVKRGETIPLSRCMTVCPLISSVVFHLSLYHPSHNKCGEDAHLIASFDLESCCTCSCY